MKHKCDRYPLLPVLELEAAVPGEVLGLHTHAHPHAPSKHVVDPETGRFMLNRTNEPRVRPCFGKVQRSW